MPPGFRAPPTRKSCSIMHQEYNLQHARIICVSSATLINQIRLAPAVRSTMVTGLPVSGDGWTSGHRAFEPTAAVDRSMSPFRMAFLFHHLPAAWERPSASTNITLWSGKLYAPRALHY